MPPSDERTDAELLTAHVRGDAEAFGVLFGRHRDRLWAIALRTMGNPDDAADGLQDGLIAAYRRAGSFRGEAAVTTWLHRVVVNACLDRLRSAKVRRAEPLPDDLDALAGGVPTPDARAEDPGDHVVATERRQQVLAALAELPVEMRASLVLVDMEGYGVAEAADILGCAVGTVKSRCSRGRARLAETLGMLAPARDPDHGDPGNPPGAGPVRSPEPRGPPASA